MSLPFEEKKIVKVITKKSSLILKLETEGNQKHEAMSHDNAVCIWLPSLTLVN
jgi:hypothetical protein